MKKLLTLFASLCIISTPVLAQNTTAPLMPPGSPLSHPLTIVAAENFYGDVAMQLGGSHVTVSSILSNPDQDPHLFEADPRTARALSNASLVIYNGADYDPWMDKLLQASSSAQRTILVAADLTGKKAGDNPHLWYAPQTMPAVARAIHHFLDTADPANQADYDHRYQVFLDSLQPIAAQVAKSKRQYAGRPVTATEPVFGYMADAIGLNVHNPEFQLAVMNDTEPSAKDIAAFENDLKQRRVQVLIYNSQATGALTRRMLALAKSVQIPAVQVTETEPSHMNYQSWMLSQLNALDAALASHAP
jgi:zinc/manganese transport system substrate-binding protein